MYKTVCDFFLFNFSKNQFFRTWSIFYNYFVFLLSLNKYLIVKLLINYAYLIIKKKKKKLKKI